MIKHIVMWTLKDEAEGGTSAENGIKMKQILENLSGKIDELKHIEVSVDVFAAIPDCNVVLYSEFETKDDLDAYQVHPLHQACVAFIKQVVASRNVIDYVI
ncbi:Dabb family protein [Desulfovibrio gilichinskyi]|uniref:Stress responsive A/B Barrel Domain n=1 Tax=Desulfovibrio gilichinskyi TaxID=1519643 RepID=A0A1X7C2Q0_9BACT|nr:Dabb family protein [Desulfovibrio gilichinskyi]SME88931.1 Stress responsive A/B Barrel Domain [Desulfovibrio gilichinskyi]